MSLQSLFQEIKKSFDEKQEGMFGVKPMPLDIVDPPTLSKHIKETNSKLGYDDDEADEIFKGIHRDLHKKLSKGKANDKDMKALHHLTQYAKGKIDQNAIIKHLDPYFEEGGVKVPKRELLEKSITQKLFDFFKSKKSGGDPSQQSMFSSPSVKEVVPPKVSSEKGPRIFGTERKQEGMFNPPSEQPKTWHSLHPLSNPSPEEGREVSTEQKPKVLSSDKQKKLLEDIEGIKKHGIMADRVKKLKNSVRHTGETSSGSKLFHFRIHHKNGDYYDTEKFESPHAAEKSLHDEAKSQAEDHWLGNKEELKGMGHTKQSWMPEAISNFKSNFRIHRHSTDGTDMGHFEIKKGLWGFVKSMFDAGQGDLFGGISKGTEILHPKEVLKNFTETHLNDRGALKNQNSTLNHAKVFDTYKTLHDKHISGGVGTPEKVIMHDIGKWSKGEVGDAQITKHLNKFHNIDPQAEKRKDRLPYSHQAEISRINDKLTNKQEIDPHEHNHKLVYDSYMAGKTPYSALRDHYEKHFLPSKPSATGLGRVFSVESGEGYTPEVKTKPKITMDDLRKQYTPAPEKAKHLEETDIVKPSRANTEEVSTMNAKKILESSLPLEKDNKGVRSKFKKKGHFTIEPHPEDTRKVNVHYKGGLISRDQAENWDEANKQHADKYELKNGTAAGMPDNPFLPDGVTHQQMRKIHAHYQREEKRDQPEGIAGPKINATILHDPTGEAHIETIKSYIQGHAGLIKDLKLRSSKPENNADLHNFMNNKKAYQEKYPHYNEHIKEEYKKHMDDIKADITKRAMIAAAKRKKAKEDEAMKLGIPAKTKSNPTGSWAHVKSGGGKVSKKSTGGKKSSWTQTSL